MPWLNLSFELPDGTAGSTTSANFEPFGLVDGQTLILEVDGVEETITFLAADFVDITIATAAEVAAVIADSSVLVTASDSGGAVLVETIEHSTDTCLRITGGSARPALGLDTDTHCGLTQPGTALYWSIAATSTAETIANFDFAFVQAVEDFEEEWLSNEAFAFVLGDTQTGTFNPVVGPTLVESFEYEWGTVIFEVGPALAAAFTDPDTLVQNLAAEDWEFDAISPSLTTGTFDTALENAEDFEEEWANDAFIYTLPFAIAGDFDAGGEEFEDFEQTTTELGTVAILSADVAGAYQIVVNGRPFGTITDGAGIDVITVATELTAAINNDSLCAVTAEHIVDPGLEHTLILTPKDPGNAISVHVMGPRPSDISFTTPDAATLWLVTDALSE